MPACPTCGAMYSSSMADERCGTCGAFLPRHDMARQTVAEASAMPAVTSGETVQPSAPPTPHEPTPEDLIRPRHLSPEYARHITAAWEATFSQFKHPKETLNSSSSAMESAADLLIGSRSVVNVTDENRGDYELTDIIGEGNMGVVWSARQAALDRDVALKVPKPSASQSELGRNQFISEVLVTGQLDHPNIVPIYDLARNEKGQLFYSMKRVEGRPWNECMHEQSATVPDNVEILMKVCDAIRFAHDRGVIHRDIKPQNIMVGRYGEVSVMDWGIALRLDSNAPGGGVTNLSPAGTPAYMAPEMATVSAGDIGPHTDVYLLGAVLYEIVTGEPPHPPPLDSEDVRQLQREALLIAARNDIKRTEKSGELIDIAYKAMATDISDRYQTVAEFQTAIREYFSHSESIKLTERGQEYYQRAVANGRGESDRNESRFDEFDRARFAFEEAIDLWPDNQNAVHGLSELILAYANYAYNEGAYARGIALLDDSNPDHKPLLRKLRAARKRTNQLSILLRAATAIIVIGGVLFTLFLFRAQREAVRQQRIAEAEAARASDQERIAEAEAARASDQEQIAKAEAKRASDQEQIAKAEAKRASDQEQIAKAEATRANKARQDAQRSSYAFEIGLAAEELQRNAFHRANQILEEQSKDEVKRNLRGWEWQYLRYFAKEQPVEEFGLPDGRPMSQRFESIAVTQDGQWIAAGTSNGKIFVWSHEKSDRPTELKYGAAVSSVAISPDGKRLAAVGTEQRIGGDGKHHIKMWDLSALEDQPTRFAEHDARILSVDFSPDGRSVLTGAADGAAHLWNIETKERLRGFYGHGQLGRDVWSGRFSPGDGHWIVTSGEDGTVRIWNAQQGGEVQRISGFREPVMVADFSPDGKFIVSGTRDGRLFASRFAPKEIAVPLEAEQTSLEQQLAGRIQSDSQKDLIPIGQHTAAIGDVSFSPDGLHLFSSGRDNTVRVWDVSGGLTRASLNRTLRGHGGWVPGCVATHDDRVLSAGYDGRVLLWDWKTYQFPRILRVEQAHQLREMPLTSAAVSQNGRWIATGSNSGDVVVWNLDNPLDPRSEMLREGHEWQPTTAIFYDKGRRLLTSGGDNTTLIWDANRGSQLLRMGGWFQKGDTRVGSGWRGVAAVAQDGRLIATGSDSSDVIARLWDAQTGTVLHQLSSNKSGTGSSSQHQEWPEATALAFAPDDQTLVAGDQFGGCYLFDTRNGALRTSFIAHNGKIIAVFFLPDGRHVLTSGADGRVVKWDVGSTPPRDVEEFRHEGPIVAMALSEDGKQIVTAVGANERPAILTCVDVSSGRTIREFDLSKELGTAAIVRSLAFDSDGKRVLITAHFPNRQTRPFELGVWDWQAGADSYQRLSDSFGDLSMALYAPNPNDAILTVGGRGARIRFANHTLMRFQSQSAINSLDFSDDDRLLATAGADGSVKIWQFDDRDRGWRPVQTLLVGQAAVGRSAVTVNSVAFSPQRSDVILIGLGDGLVEIWHSDAAGWKQATRFGPLKGMDAGIQQALFSPDGTHILATSDSAAVLLDTKSGQLVAGSAPGGNCAAFSPDGRWICLGRGNTPVIISADTLNSTRLDFGEHSGAINSVAFTGDGRRLFTASDDATVKVWDTSPLYGDELPSVVTDSPQNVRQLLTLEEHSKEVTSAISSSNLQQAFLVTTGLDGQCILWPTEPIGR